MKRQLHEGPSLDSTLKSVSNDIGNSIGILYERLTAMTQKLYDNTDSLENRGFIIGGAKKQWYETFYVNRLQNELYDLVRHAPKATKDLKLLLRNRPKNLSVMERDGLPDILADIGRKLNHSDLTKNAQRWKKRIADYNKFVDSIEEEIISYMEPVDGGSASQKAPKDPTKGKQLSQVEKVVNDVLSSLPKKQAGEIRQEIARADNKLQALALAMKKRGLNP